MKKNSRGYVSILGLGLFVLLICSLTPSINNGINNVLNNKNTKDQNFELNPPTVDLKTSLLKHWNKTCGDYSIEATEGPIGGGIAVDSKNNSYVLCTNNNISGHEDFNVLKYDKYGDLIWNRTYDLGSGDNERAYDIAINGTDSIFLTGYIYEDTVEDLILMCIDEDGNKQWNTTYGKSGSTYGERGYGVAFDSDGNIYVCGRNSSSGAGLKIDCLLVKFDNLGNYVWNRSYDWSDAKSYDDEGYDIAINNEDIIYITGYTGDAGTPSLVVLNYTKQGQKCWTSAPYIYNDPQTSYGDFGYGIDIDSNNTVYVTGKIIRTTLILPEISDMVLLRLTENLTEVWGRIWHAYDDRGEMVRVDEEENIWVVLNSDKRSTGTKDVWLTKYDIQGNNLLNETWYYEGNGDYARDMYIAPDDSIYIMGKTSKGLNEPIFILKLAFEPNDNFDLWSNAGQPDYDGGFSLFWTEDASAKNYSVYQNTIPFSDVKLATELASEIEENTYEVSDLGTGTYYYRIMAFNNDGNSTSKQHRIDVKLSDWDKDWNVTSGDYHMGGRGVDTDSENNSIIVGYFENQLTEDTDAYIAKYDTRGDLVWDETWDSGNHDADRAYDVKIDKQNNIYVTGYTTHSNDQLFILKLDKNGNQLWQYVYGGSGITRGHGIALDSSGDVYVCGQNNTNLVDILLMKFTSSGNSIWNRSYDYKTNIDIGWDIAVDSEDLIYVTGEVKDDSADIIILKYNRTGHENWTGDPFIWDGHGEDDVGYGICINKTDDVFVTGKSGIGGAFLNVDMILIALNSSLNETWIKRWDAGREDIGQGVAIDEDNNIWVVLSSDVRSNGIGDYWMAVYNTTGQCLFNKTWYSMANDYVEDIAISDEGNIYIIGDTTNMVSRLRETMLLEYTRNPEEFKLDSNAGAPDDDGAFNLYWSQSDKANVYDVYESPEYITDIYDRDVTKIENNLKTKSYSITGKTDGTYYYLVLGENNVSNVKSNCIEIEVEIPTSSSPAQSPSPTITHYAPGTFILSTDATSPDTDGKFKLTWTTSDGATSYEIYTYSSKITKINSTIGQPINTTSGLVHSLTFTTANTTYFIIVAKNSTGNTLSNSLSVTVKFDFGAKSPVEQFLEFLGTPAGIASVTAISGGAVGTTILAIKWGDIAAARARKVLLKPLEQRVFKKGAKETFKQTEKKRRRRKRKKKLYLEMTDQIEKMTEGINSEITAGKAYGFEWAKYLKIRGKPDAAFITGAQFDSISLLGQYSSNCFGDLKDMQMKEVLKALDKARPLNEKQMYGKKVLFLKLK